jgi:hypothetical protein
LPPPRSAQTLGGILGQAFAVSGNLVAGFACTGSGAEHAAVWSLERQLVLRRHSADLEHQ